MHEIEEKMSNESLRWRFYLEPEGPELAFLNTRNLVLQSFLSLFYFDKISGRPGKGCKIYGTDKIAYQTIKTSFYQAQKFYTLS